jgi:hypothetical protein
VTGVAAERHWPRMDPPNVLWFFGAFTLELAVYALIQAVPDTHSRLWSLVAAVAFFLAFVVLAASLLRSGWWVPGGLAGALAVGVFPAVGAAFLTLVGVWPSTPFFPLDNFEGWEFALGLATAAVGLAVWWWTRFSFVLAVAIAAILVSAQLLMPWFDDNPSGDQRAVMAIVIGAILFVAGVFVDAFGRRREAFWLEVLGLFSVAAGLVWLATIDGRPDRGWLPILVASVALLIAAGPVRRASWAVYGVVGAYAGVLHYLSQGLDETGWVFPALLIVLSVVFALLGAAQHRYGRTWADRFVRRPPPELS